MIRRSPDEVLAEERRLVAIPAKGQGSCAIWWPEDKQADRVKKLLL